MLGTVVGPRRIDVLRGAVGRGGTVLWGTSSLQEALHQQESICRRKRSCVGRDRMNFAIFICFICVVMSVIMSVRAMFTYFIKLIMYLGNATIEAGELKIDMRLFFENAKQERWWLIELMSWMLSLSSVDRNNLRALVSEEVNGAHGSSNGSYEQYSRNSSLTTEAISQFPKNHVVISLSRETSQVTNYENEDEEMGGMAAVEVEEDEMCPICIQSYSNHDEVRTLPCKHFFHSNCVDEWLERSSSCPICATELQGQVEQVGDFSALCGNIPTEQVAEGYERYSNYTVLSVN